MGPFVSGFKFGTKTMKAKNILKTVGLGLVVSTLAALNASALYVYESMPSGLAANDVSGNSSAYYEVGNEFQVNSTINVTSLGFFDPNSGGNTVPIAVAIFQDNGGIWSQVANTYNLFAANTIATSGSTAMQNISPVQLLAGTYAIVAGGGGQTGNGYWNSSQPNPGSAVPTFNNGGGLISQIDQAQWALPGFADPGLTAWPSGPSGAYLSPYGAGTFGFSAVPEIQTFAVAGVAMLGLVFVGRKVTTRRRN